MSGLVVVKVGGSDGVDLDAVCDDVAELFAAGRRLVLLHGGSAETNRVSAALGRPPRFVTSPSGHQSRFTDRAALEVFTMVYCGKVNKGIVERLQARGVNAVGLSGVDGRTLEGRRKDSVRSVEDGRVRVLHGDHTGVVERVNVRLLSLLLDEGHLPVLTPPAISYEGVAINVDGDRAAAAVAGAMGARALLLLSNVPGLLREFPDEASLVRRLSRDSLDAAMGYAGGRMKKKLLGAREALAAGVQRVVLGDARRRRPVSAALAGTGTVVT
ncbi:MAG TPA: [LysW]-aminoadipate kinase [Trueperaceae bacterium]|nr:[LysW]-aminoadipate kinase [Trueperaceae bacterium]